jgi:hypothetical protein
MGDIILFMVLQYGREYRRFVHMVPILSSILSSKSILSSIWYTIFVYMGYIMLHMVLQYRRQYRRFVHMVTYIVVHMVYLLSILMPLSSIWGYNTDDNIDVASIFSSIWYVVSSIWGSLSSLWYCNMDDNIDDTYIVYIVIWIAPYGLYYLSYIAQ